MDKGILSNNIAELMSETEICIKILKKDLKFFVIDEESDEHIDEFIEMMEKKLKTLKSSKTKDDIKKNIKRRKIYEEWKDIRSNGDLYFME